MPEIFTSQAITAFIDNITQFPTLIFTGLMIFVTLYWLVSLLGLVGHHTVDGGHGDISGSHLHGSHTGDLHVTDGNVNHLNHHGHDGHHADVGFLASLLMRFGLQGVPILVILTLFTLSGWLISYLLMYGVNAWFGSGVEHGLIHYVLAGVALLLTVWLSLEVTSLIVKPIRNLIKSSPERTANTMLGKVAKVRTLTVDASHGEAVIEESGATLILKVRAFEGNFVMGDSVRLIEYFPNDNSYRIEEV